MGRCYYPCPPFFCSYMQYNALSVVNFFIDNISITHSYVIEPSNPFYGIFQAFRWFYTLYELFKTFPRLTVNTGKVGHSVCLV